ncbi:hypothetical protein BRAS3843_520062 [Bradyrhizobium sp. STM 3843]|nr:hypothetical protein BRAS3843_520062 [Bradyrhizobium sp. STM 3843]
MRKTVAGVRDIAKPTISEALFSLSCQSNYTYLLRSEGSGPTGGGSTLPGRLGRRAGDPSQFSAHAVLSLSIR